MICNSKPIPVIVLMTALASLVGCAGKIRYPSYYVLNVPAPAPGADRPAPILGSVAVREFDAPGFLRAGPIMYRETPDRLGFYDYDRWAVAPRRTVTGAVIQEMRSRGAFRSVDRFDGRETQDCLVTGTIDHLEEVDQGANVWIEVALSAQLSSVRTGEVLWQGTSSKKVKLDQRSVSGVVAEMSREMGSAVEALVSSMLDGVSTASSALSRPKGGQ